MPPVLPNPHGQIATLRQLEIRERVDALNAHCEAASAEAIIRHVVGEAFPGRVAVVSSFGAESAVLLHLVAAIDPTVAIVFLDTLRHFQATLDYHEALVQHLGLTNIHVTHPDPAGLAAEDPNNDLALRDADRCCHVRKTLPMVRALQKFDCLMTGRKRFQAAGRAELAVFEAQDRWVKVNPIARWSKDEVDGYFARFGLPPHPLTAHGFTSIGCEPCTRAVAPGEDARAGRWADSGKTECGIHFGLDGQIRRGNGQAG